MITLHLLIRNRFMICFVDSWPKDHVDLALIQMSMLRIFHNEDRNIVVVMSKLCCYITEEELMRASWERQQEDFVPLFRTISDYP